MALTGDTNLQSQWKCPTCSSEAIQRARVIYESGRTDLAGNATGVGVAGIGNQVAVGVSNTMLRGSNLTGLAARLAPPSAPKKSEGYLGGALGLVVGIFSCQSLTHDPDAFATLKATLTGLPDKMIAVIGMAGLFSWLILPPIGALVERSVRLPRYQRLRFHYDAAMSEWNRLFFCHRCGATFRLEV